jgi:hypothetical protein
VAITCYMTSTYDVGGCGTTPDWEAGEVPRAALGVLALLLTFPRARGLQSLHLTTLQRQTLHAPIAYRGERHPEALCAEQGRGILEVHDAEEG